MEQHLTRGYDLDSGGRMALLIGVGQHRPHQGFRRLPDTALHVSRLARALSSSDAAYRIQYLVDDGSSAPPTKATVMLELQRLSSNADSTDLLLVYFSGYAVRLAGQTYLMPSDGYATHPEASGIPFDWMRDTLGQSAAAVRLLFIDACALVSDAKGVVVDAPDVPPFALAFPAVGQAIVSAWRHDVLPSEGQSPLVPDGSRDGSRSGASHFSTSLIEGLEGEAAGEDGLITLSSLHRYMCEAASSQARTSSMRVRLPMLEARLEGEVPLMRRPLQRPAQALPPHRGSGFVGRVREREALKALLQTHRLVTVRGPGGMGKTFLAWQVANEIQGAYADGMHFIALDQRGEARSLLRVMAEAVALPGTSPQPLVEHLADWLSSRQMLVILDGCEHRMPEVVEVVERLLHDCPSLSILITSRRSLKLNAEVCYDLTPLSLPPTTTTLEAMSETLLESDAIQLLVARAQRSVPGFKVDDANARPLAFLCHRLEGIPLAIELAAARLKVLSLTQLVQRLNQALPSILLQVLAGGERGVPDRQKSLRASIDWSYALLTAEEQLLFQRLSVFREGFSLAAVEAICSEQLFAPYSVSTLLARLEDHSLVRVSIHSGTPRYHLLETLREYGEEKLREAGEASGQIWHCHS